MGFAVFRSSFGVVFVEIFNRDGLFGNDGFRNTGIAYAVVVIGYAGAAVERSVVADGAGHGAGIFGSFAVITEVEGVTGLTGGRHLEWRSEIKPVGGIIGSGDVDWLPRTFIIWCSGVKECSFVERQVAFIHSLFGLFLDISGKAFEDEWIFGVAVLDIGAKFDEFALSVIDFTDDFGGDVAIGGDGPVHVSDVDASIGFAGAAFGIEEVEVDNVARFETGRDSSDTRRARTGVFDLVVI